MAQYNTGGLITINGIATSYASAKKGLDKIVTLATEKMTDFVPMLYKADTFNQKTKTLKVYSGIPAANEWTSTLNEIPTVGRQYLYDVDATHTPYAIATEHNLESKWFDEYGFLDNIGEMIAKSLMDRKQRLGATFFNAAFTTAWTGDGEYFFDSDHPYDTSYSASTQSNIVSGALGVSTLNEAIYKITNIKDPLGRPMSLKPKYLYVDPTKAPLARQILNKDMEYGTANRNSSPFSNQSIEVVEYPWFSTATKWMLQADSTFTKFSLPVGFTTNIEETRAHGTKFEGWFSIAFWAERWQGWVGSLGT